MRGIKRKRLDPPDLPENLLEEILLKLPVKSLIRFKCVCKSWSARLQNPDFIWAHYRNQEIIDSAEFGASKFLIKRFYSSREHCFAYVECKVDGEDEVYLKVKEDIFIPCLRVEMVDSFQFQDYGGTPRVLGPCNGIICLNDDVDTALWNPAIREFKFLPASNVVRPSGTIGVSYSFAIAFGYDHKTDDYKILRSVYNQRKESIGFICQYELYSLRKNEWREIQVEYAIANSGGSIYNMSIDGVYHCPYHSYGVVSFDLMDEVFTFTEYPKDWVSYHLAHKKLVPFNKCPAIVRHDSHVDIVEGNLNVWVLKEIGAVESWRIELTKGPNPDIIRILGFWKGKVFASTRNHEILIYNPSSQRIRGLGFGVPFLEKGQVIHYVESLVLINWRFEHEVGIVCFLP